MLVCFKTVLCFYPQILYSNLNSANTEKCDITFLETPLKQQHWITVMLILSNISPRVLYWSAGLSFSRVGTDLNPWLQQLIVNFITDDDHNFTNITQDWAKSRQDPKQIGLHVSKREKIISLWNLWEKQNHIMAVLTDWTFHHGLCTELILMHVSWEELRLALQCV